MKSDMAARQSPQCPPWIKDTFQLHPVSSTGVSTTDPTAHCLHCGVIAAHSCRSLFKTLAETMLRVISLPSRQSAVAKRRRPTDLALACSLTHNCRNGSDLLCVVNRGPLRTASVRASARPLQGRATDHDARREKVLSSAPQTPSFDQLIIKAVEEITARADDMRLTGPPQDHVARLTEMMRLYEIAECLAKRLKNA